MKNCKKALLLALPLLCAAYDATGAQRLIEITDNYLHIPVSHSCDRVRISLSADGMEAMPVNVRIAAGAPDYWVFKDVSALKGKILTST